MKKIILGLVAAFALTCIAAPARAEGEAAAGDAPAKTEAPAKTKKHKKSKKAKAAPAEEGAAPAGDEGKK